MFILIKVHQQSIELQLSVHSIPEVCKQILSSGPTKESNVAQEDKNRLKYSLQALKQTHFYKPQIFVQITFELSKHLCICSALEKHS